MSQWSTLGDVRARVRRYLRESTANEWSDAVINEKINDEHRDLGDELAQFRGQGWNRIAAAFTVPADTETFDLDGLSGIFGEINTLYLLRTDNVKTLCERVIDGQDNRYTNLEQMVSSNTTPVYWVARDGQTETLHLLPRASQPRNFEIIQSPVIPDLVADTDVLYTPKRYDNLLARRVQRACLVDVEDESAVLERDIMRLTARMEDRESQGTHRDKWERIDTDQGDRAFQSGSFGRSYLYSW